MRGALMDAPAAAPAPGAPVFGAIFSPVEEPAQQVPRSEPLGPGINLKMLALLLEKLASFKPESSETVGPALRILA